MTTTELAPQTIHSLTVEAFKRITDVEIVPDVTTPTVVVTGRNAQGKSSVLDAIETVLTGVDKRRTPAPIHEGKAAARIVAETDDLTITRTFHEKSDGSVASALTVTAKDGARYGSPQKMLDELLGNISVDPVEFANQDAKKQRATLLSLVDLPFDLDALDKKRAETFAQRTDANREVKNLTAQVEAIQERLPADGANTQETSAGDLINRIQEAQKAEAALYAVKDRVDSLKRRKDSIEEQITSLKSQLWAVNADLEAVEAEQDTRALAPREDPQELSAQLATIEETNREARANAAAFAEAERLEDLEHVAMAKAGELDLLIRDIDQRKADGLAVAQFPVAGLGVSENGVTYQGRPFEQASTAERIKVSVGVATAKLGTIRVLLIRGGEALDSENLDLIGKLAADAGCQVWIEAVKEERTLGVFHLEDGRLAQ